MQNVQGENHRQNKEDHKSLERTNSHLYKNKFGTVGARALFYLKINLAEGEIKKRLRE